MAEPLADEAALYRLMSWLSPAYPVGAFSYSHGIERAVETGAIADRAGTEAWIAGVLTAGGGLLDAVFLTRAHAAAVAGDGDALGAANELAVAFAPSAERRLETTAQGNAFLKTSLAAWPVDSLPPLAAALGDGPAAYPVAVGLVAACHGVPVDAARAAYLHAFAANLVSAAVRLVPLGQTDGQRITAALAGTVRAVAERAAAMPPEAVGGAALAADVASMQHETQYTRLFRS